MKTNEKECPACNGKGSTKSIDLMKARSLSVVCAKCKGTGKIIETTDGPRIGVIYAPTIFFQMIRDDKIAATLECRQRPVVDELGRILVKKDRTAMFAKDKETPREYLEIARMTTKPEYRKQGIMTELLCLSAGNKNLEWIETLYDDSTDEGRAFLMSHGFKHEGSKLIWEKNDGQRYPSGSAVDSDGAEQQASDNAPA